MWPCALGVGRPVVVVSSGSVGREADLSAAIRASRSRTSSSVVIAATVPARPSACFSSCAVHDIRPRSHATLTATGRQHGHATSSAPDLGHRDVHDHAHRRRPHAVEVGRRSTRHFARAARASRGGARARGIGEFWQIGGSHSHPHPPNVGHRTPCVTSASAPYSERPSDGISNACADMRRRLRGDSVSGGSIQPPIVDRRSNHAEEIGIRRPSAASGLAAWSPVGGRFGELRMDGLEALEDGLAELVDHRPERMLG